MGGALRSVGCATAETLGGVAIGGASLTANTGFCGNCGDAAALGGTVGWGIVIGTNSLRRSGLEAEIGSVTSGGFAPGSRIALSVAGLAWFDLESSTIRGRPGAAVVCGC